MQKSMLLIIYMLSQFANRTNGSEVIPFETIGNLIIVSTVVDGRKGNYIVDTGVPTLILNKQVFHGEKSDREMIGISGEGTVETKYSKVTMGRQTWKGVYCEITDLTAIEQGLGIPIDGLIGCRLFRKFTVVFDYAKQEIRLSLSGRRGEIPPIMLNDSNETSIYEWKGHVPIIQAYVGSEKLKLIIDTGSAYNVFGSSYLKKLDEEMMQWDRQMLVGIGEGQSRVEAATIFNLEVGNKICSPMRTLFHDDRRISRLCPGRSVHGVLGYEYLSQVLLSIDFKNHTMAIVESSDAYERMIAR